MPVDTLFEKELLKQGAVFKRVDSDRYEIKSGDMVKTVSLQNIAKEYARDGDASAVTRFVAAVLAPIVDLPDWSNVKASIFISLEPADLEGLADTIHRKLSEEVTALLAFHDRKANHVRWLSKADLHKLGVREDAAWRQAQENLEKIALAVKITYVDIDDQKLGMLEAPEPYKASLILTQALKQNVSKELGWPLYAVAPSRDFVFLFSKQGGLIKRVGGEVVSEYRKAGHPLSTEVWELSDGKQTAMGAFPKK